MTQPSVTETTTIRGLRHPVSRIALGTWAIGGWMWGGPDDRQAVATIHEALDLGITLIDTAPVYGFGHSEEIVGQAVAGRRDRVAIATKVGLDWNADHKPFRNTSAARIRREIEDSLRRLRTDYIDLYQVHWPDSAIPMEETARTLEDLVREGKVLALGVSNFTIAQMEAFREFAPLSTVQPPYNLFERAMEHDILPYARQHDLAILAYGPLCRGLLSGKMTAETKFGPDDLRSADPKFQPPRFAHYLQAVRELQDFARERHGKSLLALAIRWVLDQGPTIALWGARRPDQIAAVADATGWQLSAEDRREIDAILTRCIPDPVGPEFMAPPGH
ncbi:aldo/keto reductase [Komagataeibacter rhaeticus]|uniref:Aldo/keto reductase n=1 Tax=Komagataeibacter rhaeticus TaxID=215221 RepID=A0A181CDQ8_9PROT|nr:aldo/keto reductase [Komagataeibacter rhaeticus]ATU71664.1 aldo/keto reductase [Komagataeibacter xylinus]EGG77349.1 General stress protein 69 [Gluconacetobacter sp. SXCC-1]KDU96896.1 general stress protein [Komagataeibacter rhaeticus AF1]MBL7240638.1 aldo/keto reductase [Komagataeibacter rhaeticus]PYD53864.1 aldo/keto reductase [Komagataeibacter rhaeticus]